MNSAQVRPLHEACAAGHAAVVGLLLRHGADPSAPAAQWRWCDERSVDAPFGDVFGTPLEVCEESGDEAAAAAVRRYAGGARTSLDAYPEPEGAARPPELLETAAAWRGDAAERTPLHDAAKMADGGDALRVCGALLRRGAAVDVAEVDDVRPCAEFKSSTRLQCERMRRFRRTFFGFASRTR